MARIKIGLCGHGYWGQNLFRTFSNDPGFDLVGVSDIRRSAREKARRTKGAIRLCEEAAEMLADPNIVAAALATPAASHFSLAHLDLLRDKHVLVEKPMC